MMDRNWRDDILLREILACGPPVEEEVVRMPLSSYRDMLSTMSRQLESERFLRCEALAMRDSRDRWRWAALALAGCLVAAGVALR